VSIIVIDENGLQSQPEKRSLQASDGSNSLNGGFFKNSRRLIGAFRADIVGIIHDWITEPDVGRKNVIKNEEQSIVKLTKDLLNGQDLPILIGTSIITLYMLNL